jgi:hypothetical protein
MSAKSGRIMSWSGHVPYSREEAESVNYRGFCLGHFPREALGDEEEEEMLLL